MAFRLKRLPAIDVFGLLVVFVLASGALAGDRASAAQLQAVDAPHAFFLRIDGAKQGDSIGAAAPIGDMNGDGREDFVIGSARADTGGQRDNGGAWVVFSPARRTVIDLAHLGRRGFRIDGRPPVFRRERGGRRRLIQRDCAGTSVAGAGDVNGDKRPDVIIGDPCFRSGASQARADGAAYVIFGKTSPKAIELAHLGRRGVRIAARGRGKRRYHVGRSVAGVGDMNADHRSEVIVSAEPELSDDTPHGRGGAFVVFGSRSRRAVDLNRLGRRGYRIRGIRATDDAGAAVGGVGDVNRDGIPDVFLGAPNYWVDFNRMTAGAVLVVFGKSSSSTIDLAKPGYGYPILAAARDRVIGAQIADAGDVNGDGRPDLVLGAAGAAYDGQRIAGSAFVVFGQRTGPVDLANLGSQGFRIDGPAGTTYTTPVAAAGDVNGDGRADVMVAAPFFEAARPVTTYLVFGTTAGPVDLGALDQGAGGFQIAGRVIPRGSIEDPPGGGRSGLLLSDSSASNHGRRHSGSVYLVRSP